VTLNGIDVAGYQSVTYDTTHLDFVFVKATEGSGYVNPHHDGQVATARGHNLALGHYHFVRPGSMTVQVDHFLTHAKAQPGDMLVLDWEDTGVSGADKDAWLKHAQAKAPGHRVILYCNRDFWLHRDTTSYCADALWIADPSAPAGHPRITHPWTFHQYSEAGGLDHDVANFADRATLDAWVGKLVKPHVVYEPFPGATWFHHGRRSPIVAAMHKRLVEVGCNHYRSSKNQDVIGSGDEASYEAWQRKCGYHGKAATWPPGKTTWDKLKVPKQ